MSLKSSTARDRIIEVLIERAFDFTNRTLVLYFDSVNGRPIAKTRLKHIHELADALDLLTGDLVK